MTIYPKFCTGVGKFIPKLWRQEQVNKLHRKFSREYSTLQNEERGSLGGLLICLTGAVVTGSLCFWQVKRTNWKSKIIEQRKCKIAQPERPLDAVVIDSVHGLKDVDNVQILSKVRQALEFRTVQVCGHYAYDSEVLVGYASAPIDIQNTGSHEHQKGYYILTPFILEKPIQVHINEDRSIVIEKVFVNRGWIPSQVSLSYIKNPVRENGSGEIDRVHGIVHFGVQDDTKPSNLIVGTAKDGVTHTYQQMYPDKIANAIDIDFSSFFVNSQAFEFPTIIVDSFNAPPSQRVPAHDIELQSQSNSNINIKPVRRSSNDYVSFYTTPATHVVYALTWGTLCLFSTYAFLGRYIFLDMRISRWFRKTTPNRRSFQTMMDSKSTNN